MSILAITDAVVMLPIVLYFIISYILISIVLEWCYNLINKHATCVLTYIKTIISFQVLCVTFNQWRQMRLFVSLQSLSTQMQLLSKVWFYTINTYSLWQYFLLQIFNTGEDSTENFILYSLLYYAFYFYSLYFIEQDSLLWVDKNQLCDPSPARENRRKNSCLFKCNKDESVKCFSGSSCMARHLLVQDKELHISDKYIIQGTCLTGRVDCIMIYTIYYSKFIVVSKILQMYKRLRPLTHGHTITF